MNQTVDITDPSFYRVDIDDMRRQRTQSYLLTAAFFLQDQLTVPIAPFHESVWQQLRELRGQMKNAGAKQIKKVFTVPREHNKTTIVKLFCVDSFRENTGISFILYCSSTFSSAANACRDIVRWLLLPGEEILWGKGKQIKQNETEGLWILEIPCANGRMKEVILKAVGVDKQIRGLNIFSRRPDMIVCDDIEDLNTADGGKQQQKLDEWFFGTLMKAAASRSILLLIGNIIRSTTLLARLCDLPDWNPTRYGAIVRGEGGELEPLWPGMHSVESLLSDYRQYRRLAVGHVWESEMMNLSRDAMLADSISSECVVPDPHPESIKCGFIAVDPAFGLEQYHDESALTVHVQTGDHPVPVLVDSDKGRWTEKQLLDHILDLIYRWGLTTVAIEAVAAQKLLIPLFRALMQERGMDPEAILFIPLQGQREKGAKASRIRAFRQACQAGSYFLAESQFEFKLALEEWSPETSEHDDLPDSGSLGAIVWEKMGTWVETGGRRVKQVGSLLEGRPDDSVAYLGLGENQVAGI